MSEYLTVAELRAEYGDALAAKSDEDLQRRLDRLTAYLEDQLGHTCGRAIYVWSTTAAAVEVTATALIVAGDSYAFATYQTLDALVDAVNGGAGKAQALLLPQMRGDTPSTLLSMLPTTSCGGGYDKRVCLTTTAMYMRLSGNGETHLFLPLPLRSVNSVYEDGYAVSYTAEPGKSWLVRRPAGSCWRSGNGNIAVTYTPRWWGQPPAPLGGVVLEAFAAVSGLAPFESESFGGAYSYRRNAPPAQHWQTLLSGPAVRPYMVRFHP